MEFTKKEIEKLSQLARIELSEEEKKKFGKQIASILDYIKQIQEVDTKKIKVDSHLQGLTNVYKQDKKVESNKTREIVDQFPKKHGHLNKVKPVL